MAERRQGKIIRWIRKFTTAQDTSEKNSEATEPRMGTVVESEYLPSKYAKRDDKTKNTHEQVRTALTGIAVIVSIFAYCAARQSATFAGKTADAAQKNVATAQAALKATIENSRLDQRAWVGVIKPLAPELKVGGKTAFGVTLVNSGKTPAHKAVSYIVARSVIAGESPSISYSSSSPHRSVTILSPQIPASIYVPDARTFVETEVEDIKNKRVTVYLFGKVSYEDIARQAHCLTFCYWLSSDLQQGYACGIYNEETDAQCPE